MRVLSDLSYINKPFCEQFVLRNYHMYLHSVFSRAVLRGLPSEIEFFHLYGNLLAEQAFDSICLSHITNRVLTFPDAESVDAELLQDYIDKFFWIISLSGALFSR